MELCKILTKILLAGLIVILQCFNLFAKECSEIGCSNGLNLAISPNYIWQAGSYEFIFQIDNQRNVCHGVLPFENCEKHVVCSGDNPDVIMITESGCALPKNSHGFGDIFIAKSPAQILIEIKRNDRLIVNHKMAPQYITSQPNGEGCEPICRQAMINLHLK